MKLNMLQKAANVLIFYQLLSLFFGVNKFFNSFSNLFFLNRNSELIILEKYRHGEVLPTTMRCFQIFKYLFCLLYD